MTKNYFFFSPWTSGWDNLAADEWFLDHLEEGELMLYLYCNRNAVVIGKNQNPWKECSLAAMEADDVELVRRVSGGGAVFHDEGNLNFSFIAGAGRYDLARQMDVIITALHSVGIDAMFSGRNDLTVQGKKFSGNAFCGRHENHQHHGTLLIHADLGRLARYLQVDPKKIKSKGIDSVRSRVCNLREFCPGLTIHVMAEALRSAFVTQYGSYVAWEMTQRWKEQLIPYQEKQRSWEWRMGKAPAFTFEIEERFSWGNIELHFSVRNGKIIAVKVYSDALDDTLAPEIEKLLYLCRMDERELHMRLMSQKRDEIRQLAPVLIRRLLT